MPSTFTHKNIASKENVSILTGLGNKPFSIGAYSIMEVWKDVVGLEQYYEISNLGNIKLKYTRYLTSLGTYSCKYPRLLKPQKTKCGYYQIFLKHKGILTGAKGVYLHRLVAQAFIPNVNNKPYVNHKNGIKSDNRAENLEWVTRSENALHSISIGLQKIPKGMECHYKKLTDVQVVEIRNKYKPKGEYSSLRLSKEYGVSNTQIKDIIKRKSWKHI